jgi:type I site-specific restriction-modification system R (restriction) subunit
MVFIFDECHRSQFGENHKAIREFFPDAQLFGFTGTPIFEENASHQQIEGRQASCRTTADIFRQQLHAYTITHAIEDRNVLRFHVDYFRPEGHIPAKTGEPLEKKAIVEAILAKHDAATNGRKFNALLATSSINDAIEYHELFKTVQAERAAEDESFRPLNVACVFSPPAEGNKDVRQIQEDLPQEKADNEQEPDKKKEALGSIIDDYNARYGTNHRLGEFDLYCQDVQKRIKDQQYPNGDLPHGKKIDIAIVVDMLLTGFDSKFLNTLYVDKNLKHHGLIQAFSRTNRVFNDTKPYGNILDFRRQQEAVDVAIGLFSGETAKPASEPFRSEIFISEELFSEISRKYGLPVAGDFLVSGVGTLGISYQVQSSDRFYFKDSNVLWFKSKGKLVSNFFKYQLQPDAIQDQIRGQSAISTVGTYTIQNAKKTKFSLPTCIEEQQKIADCLSSIDELIALGTQKLDALKTHKKGLMQELFPVLGEVPV